MKRIAGVNTAALRAMIEREIAERDARLQITPEEVAAQYEAVRIKPEEVAQNKLSRAEHMLSEDGLTARLRIRTPWDKELEVYATIDAADLERANDHAWWGIRHGGKIQVVSSGEGLNFMPLGRFVLEITDPAIRVRHKNYDLLDNRRANLLICAPAGQG